MSKIKIPKIDSFWDSLYPLLKNAPPYHLWAKVCVRINIASNTECWIWKGAVNPGNGYGSYTWSPKKSKTHTIMPHRQMGVWIHGMLPKNWVIDHRVCNTRSCINPTHLLPCTHTENLIRRGSKAVSYFQSLQTRCKRGHLLNEENCASWGLKLNKRVCKQCCRIREAAYKKKSDYENNKNKWLSDQNLGWWNSRR